MITPHSDAGSNVNYIQGLSGTQPVTYTFPDSTQFNPVTGDIRFAANAAQITVVAMEINEYRNGVWIGSIERDIELIFENCTNNPPTLSGINGTIDDVVHICADSTLAFFLKSADLDTNNHTYVMWDSGIPGATFITSGTYRDTGYFSWHPTAQYIRSQPYSFTATVVDDACPAFGTNSRTFTVYVDSCFATSAPAIENNFESADATYSADLHSIIYHYKLAESSTSSITLYDLSGRKIISASAPHKKEINGEMQTGNLVPGFYILNISTGNGYSKSKWITVPN